ncbi:hypothetical protein FIBSPDRAFT_945504 [Athelia psychrophila]|uniref:CxC1-like cysteine cluster associated with KDZ transposases domain-containing protein n=1 Tax=Athelia psychrophila TaxID=1759441 RepID=A0A166TUJ8_9AGAM|nr:hypothetical protein FIBSPDRAFT_945504 [Fibularhizoctonia sp. CBS 109695]
MSSSSFPLSKARKKQKVADTSAYCSPRRPRDKRRTAEVIYSGDTDFLDRLQARLNTFLAPTAFSDPTADDAWMDVDRNEPDSLGAQTIEEPPPPETDHKDFAENSLPTEITKSQCRILPNSADFRLYNKWIAIIPTLVEDYIQYYNTTIGKRAEPCPDEIYRESECGCLADKPKVTTLTCLYHDCEEFSTAYMYYMDSKQPDYRKIKVFSCSCQPLPRKLIRNGLFLAAPSQPNIAVSQAFGTKMHQRTRAAITKRTPALMRAIRTFNKYCAKSSDLHDPSWTIPVPSPLPTHLADLNPPFDLALPSYGVADFGREQHQ